MTALNLEKEIPMQQKQGGIDSPRLRDFRFNLEMGLIELGKRLTAEMNAVLVDCRKDGIPLHEVRIVWVNIPSEENQDGGNGQFIVGAMRGNKLPELTFPHEATWVKVNPLPAEEA